MLGAVPPEEMPGAAHLPPSDVTDARLKPGKTFLGRYWTKKLGIFPTPEQELLVDATTPAKPATTLSRAYSKDHSKQLRKRP